jgi:GNAT superfamily N-acetyltransferase
LLFVLDNIKANFAKNKAHMQITEVKTTAHIKDFHKLPFLIYKDDPHYIHHLMQDIEGIFDPKKNKYFRHGEAVRYLMHDKQGKLIGRVAAFINHKDIKTGKVKAGGMGFFECINDKTAAFKLFDACKEWLQSKGVEAMDGPVNFGERDKYWGLITENFNLPPFYGQNYNPEYYVPFFKEYGFQIYFNQYIFHRTVNDPLQERFVVRAKRIEQDPRYEIRSIRKDQLDKFAEDFRTIYNRAWVKHEHHKGMPQVQALALMKKMKPVIDEDLIFFAYFEGKPVAFYISLPEINQIFKYVKGNFNWFGKLKFLFYKWRGVCTTTFGVAFGIDPDHQGKGLEGAIFNVLGNRVQPTGRYKDLIITWIGDFNPKMISIIEGLGASRIRTMATMRKMFDENAVFERYPIIR